MRSEENAEQILTQLGLTALEARVYLALCEYESLTAKAVSRLTKTSQPDIYRVMANLQKEGLVEKLIEKPAGFKAVRFDKGIAFLLERKRVEQDELTLKTERLLRAFKEKTFKPKSLETIDAEFIIIPQRETIISRINDAIERSKKSVDIFLSRKSFFIGITTIFAESSEKAWARGVRFRIIVESPKEEKGVEQACRFCRESPFCDMRFLPGRPKTGIEIYDKKEVFIIIDPERGLLDSPVLWSNNQSLLTVVEDYFEILWLTAMEEAGL